MPSLMVASDSLNRDIYLLNSWNGTVDLRNGMLRPHDPNDLLTKITPVQFDPKADSSLWLGHLRRVLGDNAALMEFVQTAAGYSATGDIGEEVLFLVHGPAAGGKTTTVEALKTALGEYAVTADFETFLKRQAGGIRNDIARLAGARLVTSVEVDEGQTLAEGLVKQWTGGDRITARFLHHEHIEFRPEGKLWLVCNEPPKARDTDDALWRRILRVPFEHTIPKPERDPNTKKLLTNPEVGGPAVLAWIVAGCEKWRKSGLMIPRLIETATQELRESQDPLRDFFTEKCEFLDEASIPVKALRQAYEQFATEQGIRYTLGPQQFNQRIEARGCKRMTKRYYSDAGTETLGKCWVGVGIQNQHQRRAVTHDLL
jgi:putative DNA primase/helicase